MARLGVDDPAFTDPMIAGTNPNYFGPWGVPCLSTVQTRRALVVEAAGRWHGNFTVFQTFPDIYQWLNSDPAAGTQRRLMYEDLVAGASSDPCFLIKNSEPIVVTVWTHALIAPGGISSNMAVDAYVSQINTLIQQLGDGDPITVENFDTDGNGNNFPPY